MGLLTNKAGIVTGAAQGLGLSVAEHLGREGPVALVDIKAEEVTAEAARLVAQGMEVIAIVADVSDEADTERMMATAEAAFGRLDFIHQNAAIQVEKLLHETTPDEWDRLMSVNLAHPCILAPEP